MLFDLRSPGRRAAIRVLYAFLALLLGGGLVFFGIGGGAGSTGLLTGLEHNGTGTASGFKLIESRVTSTRRAALAAPHSAPAWDAYARAVFQLADTNYVAATSTSAAGFTADGAKELAILAPIWKHYLSLAPAKPDVTLASDVAFSFFAIGTYSVAETAQEVVAASDRTVADQWAQLAVYAYLAHETDRAVLAEDKALSLTPKAQRPALKAELARYQPSKGATGATG